MRVFPTFGAMQRHTGRSCPLRYLNDETLQLELEESTAVDEAPQPMNMAQSSDMETPPRQIESDADFTPLM